MKTPLVTLLLAFPFASAFAAELQSRVFPISKDVPEYSKLAQPAVLTQNGKSFDATGYVLCGCLPEKESNEYAKGVKFVEGDKIQLSPKATAQISASQSATPSVLDVDIHLEGPDSFKSTTHISIYKGQSIVYRYSSEGTQPILFAIQIKK